MRDGDKCRHRPTQPSPKKIPRIYQERATIGRKLINAEMKKFADFFMDVEISNWYDIMLEAIEEVVKTERQKN